MRNQSISRLLILGTPVIWIAWDVYTYFTAGNASTESATIFRYAYYAPGVAFLCGVLCGHLFFEMHQKQSASHQQIHSSELIQPLVLPYRLIEQLNQE